MGSEIKIRPYSRVIPQIYAYTTPEVDRHSGLIKIGYTLRSVHTRVSEQIKTVDVQVKILWVMNAIYDDGSGDIFTDKDFHKFLLKKGIKRYKNTEWFYIDSEDVKRLLIEFRMTRGVISEINDDSVLSYVLRAEQESAVSKTLKYFATHENSEFLWNAKMRFGKTLTAYELIKRMGIVSVLVVTNRPSVGHSWYSDYINFVGRSSGVVFISETSEIKNKPCVISREAYLDDLMHHRSKYPITSFIEFESLQNIKGSVYGGGKYAKLEHIFSQDWDLLIVDECHEGVDTYKTDIALDNIHRKFTLHMSGTPFKAIANEKFKPDAIYNYTYSDEQRAKQNWSDVDETNPYKDLPTLNMFTYRMSEYVKDVVRTIRYDREGNPYTLTFDLNEFFRVDTKGNFVYNNSVDRFLDALTTQLKYPFSTDTLRNELKHTVWLLDRVNSAKALYKKLKEHPIFSEYGIILAVGTSEMDDISYELGNDTSSLEKVKSAIKKYEKTITLTVGQLTTGVTIPEWSAIMMLSNVGSAAKYFQSIFRVQNSCVINNGLNSIYRKENCYVFDFEPARAPKMYEEYANNLSLNNYLDDNSKDKSKENIRQLINFFPIIGEDENGEMLELNPDSVLMLPRKIKAKEVAIYAQFMSNDLIKNIPNIFNHPSEILDILENVKELRDVSSERISTDDVEGIELDDAGNVVVSNEQIIEAQKGIFGDKLYDNIELEIDNSMSALNKILTDNIDISSDSSDIELDNLGRVNQELNNVKKKVHKTIKERVLTDLKSNSFIPINKAMEREIDKSISQAVNRTIENKAIDYRVNVVEKQKKLNSVLSDTSKTDEEVKQLKAEYTEELKKLGTELSSEIVNGIGRIVENAKYTAAKEVEKKKKETAKTDFMNEIRKKCRALLRAIPMFLLASAHLRDMQEICLSNLENLFDKDDFEEYTGISLESFCLLRDGNENIPGGIFDNVLFDESIKEFYKFYDSHNNWFDESQKEDIYSIIPAQKTNQIYTPRELVVFMSNILDWDRQGYFDNMYQRFTDPYIKSGFTVTEIVKRLFISNVLKDAFPDEKERLRYIFKYQIYGCCPRKTVYLCVLNYLFGFDKNFKLSEDEHNIRCFDTNLSCQNGTFNEDLYDLFGIE